MLIKQAPRALEIVREIATYMAIYIPPNLNTLPAVHILYLLLRQPVSPE